MYYQIFKEYTLTLKKKFIYLALALCLALAIPFSFAGCKKSDGKVIRINEVTHSVFYAPLYLADALGYFKDEGFDIELSNGGGANKTMAAVLSGGADVGFCGPEAVIYTYLGGSDDCPKVFGQLTKRDGSFLVGREKEDNFDWNSLAGKKVLAGRPGGVPFMTFGYVCKDIDVEYITEVEFDSMTAAFDGGVGDCCTMFEPVASDFEAAGKGYIVASVGEEAGEIPYTCFMAKSSYIEKNGDVVEGLLRAITKAVKYVNETDVDTLTDKLKGYFVGVSEESVKKSLESYIAIDAWVDDMAMRESAFNRLQDVIELAGELDKRVAFGDIVLTETAKKVYNEVYSK